MREIIIFGSGYQVGISKTRYKHGESALLNVMISCVVSYGDWFVVARLAVGLGPRNQHAPKVYKIVVI